MSPEAVDAAILLQRHMRGRIARKYFAYKYHWRALREPDHIDLAILQRQGNTKLAELREQKKRLEFLFADTRQKAADGTLFPELQKGAEEQRKAAREAAATRLEHQWKVHQHEKLAAAKRLELQRQRDAQLAAENAAAAKVLELKLQAEEQERVEAAKRLELQRLKDEQIAAERAAAARLAAAASAHARELAALPPQEIAEKLAASSSALAASHALIAALPEDLKAKTRADAAERIQSIQRGKSSRQVAAGLRAARADSTPAAAPAAEDASSGLGPVMLGGEVIGRWVRESVVDVMFGGEKIGEWVNDTEAS